MGVSNGAWLCSIGNSPSRIMHWSFVSSSLMYYLLYQMAKWKLALARRTHYPTHLRPG